MFQALMPTTERRNLFIKSFLLNFIIIAIIFQHID